MPPGRIAGGSVELLGRDLVPLDSRAIEDIRGRDISMIFQEPMTALNPVFTIGNQMVDVLCRHRDLTRRQARPVAAELLAKVNIPDPGARLDDYPHQLSGGMRQRVMIAMALSCNPQLLIADEPTTALDVTTQAQVLEQIRRCTTEFRMAVILVTHDLGVVADLTQRIAVMYAEFVVETATTDAIFARPHHPYTVGLLNSISRIDVDDPPNCTPSRARRRTRPASRRAARSRPGVRLAAARLLDRHAGPRREVPGSPIATAGPAATHLFACHNPATPEEAAAGRPLATPASSRPRRRRRGPDVDHGGRPPWRRGWAVRWDRPPLNHLPARRRPWWCPT